MRIFFFFFFLPVDKFGAGLGSEPGRFIKNQKNPINQGHPGITEWKMHMYFPGIPSNRESTILSPLAKKMKFFFS